MILTASIVQTGLSIAVNMFHVDFRLLHQVLDDIDTSSRAGNHERCPAEFVGFVDDIWFVENGELEEWKRAAD